MTFNVRFDNPKDGPDSWPYRVDDVAELVVTYLPAIVGLQEALANQVHQLQHRLAAHKYQWAGVGRDDGRASGEFCPIFYNTDLVRLEDWGVFWLSPTPDQPGSRHPDVRLPRLCTWAKLARCSGPSADQPFFAFNVHFDHEAESARVFSAKLMLERISQIAGLFPSILLGDLNCQRRDAPYVELTSSYLKDTFLEGPQPGDDSPTFTGFDVFSDDSTAITIDYIFVSGFDVAGYKVPRERRRNGRRISDHRAVVVDILRHVD